MRNIFEYPVTKEEVLEWIESEERQIQEEYDRIYNSSPINLPCGDMRPLYLEYIKKHLT